MGMKREGSFGSIRPGRRRGRRWEGQEWFRQARRFREPCVSRRTVSAPVGEAERLRVTELVAERGLLVCWFCCRSGSRRPARAGSRRAPRGRGAGRWPPAAAAWPPRASRPRAARRCPAACLQAHFDAAQLDRLEVQAGVRDAALGRDLDHRGGGLGRPVERHQALQAGRRVERHRRLRGRRGDDRSGRRGVLGGRGRIRGLGGLGGGRRRRVRLRLAAGAGVGLRLLLLERVRDLAAASGSGVAGTSVAGCAGDLRRLLRWRTRRSGRRASAAERRRWRWRWRAGRRRGWPRGRRGMRRTGEPRPAGREGPAARGSRGPALGLGLHLAGGRRGGQERIGGGRRRLGGRRRAAGSPAAARRARA